MSGIISPFGKSGVLTDVRGLTIRAYCVITSDSPSSTAFDNSYNVASISYGSTSITLNFIEPILSPKSMTVHYQWSTGNNRYVLLAGSASGLQSSYGVGYRKIANDGMTSTSNGTLDGAVITIYGGIE